MKGWKEVWNIVGSVVACTIILVMGALTAFSMVNRIHADAVSNIHDQMSMAGDEVSGFVSEKMQAAKALADTAGDYAENTNGKIDYAAFADALHAFYLTGVFDGIGIADPAGTLYSFDDKTYDISKETSFQRAIQGETLISDPVISKETGQSILVFCIPVYYNGEVVGVIAGSQTVSKLQNTLVRDFYRGFGYCHIIDNQGNVMIPSGNSESNPFLTNLFDQIQVEMKDPDQALQVNEEIKKELAAGGQGVKSLDMKEDDRVVGYLSIPSYNNWNVLCVIRDADIWNISMPLVTTSLVLTNASAAILIALILFISLSRRKSARKLEQVAYCDPITGGKNYSYFRMKVPELLKKNRETPYLILRMDVERFKQFNNSFGYDQGDRLLQRIYHALVERYPETDDQITARMYSDEFVALCRDTGEAELVRLLQEQMQAIGEEADISHTLRFCFGIYRIENPSEPLENMVDKAQLAKKNFKANPLEHSYLYSHSLMESINVASKLEAHMKDALKNGEFQVYAQPKIDLRTEKVVSAEALIRWKSPTFGFLSPAKFIPVFERNGFIQELDFFVLDKVCCFLREMLDQGEPLLPIAVNQSRLHCYNPQYLNRLQQVIEKYRISPHWIELEVTESVLLDNMDRVLEMIHSVRNLGFQVSIDDFGSGYTSLSFLQDVDVDVIKMDRSLVEGAEHSEKKHRMLQYLVEMSHALGMAVVCEGIETNRQVALIRAMGCDIAQGYYYARPMPRDEFISYLKEHR